MPLLALCWQRSASLLSFSYRLQWIDGEKLERSVTLHDKLYHACMSTLAKLVRLQPRTLRTLSLATPKLYRSSLTRAVYFSWSPISMRYPIGGRLKPRPRNKLLYKSEGYQQWQEEEAQPSRSLFVSNIHYRANHEHLREIFSPLGPIDHVYLCTLYFFIGALILTPFLVPEPEQGHRGCARVDFVKSEDAIAVYESSQAEPFFLMKRALTIEYARKPIAKNHVLFFRHFKGNEEDLRVILEDYKDHIIQIIFSECCLLSSR